MDQTSSWNVGQRNGLVSIGEHALWLQAAGPDRVPGDPVVIIITGLASCAASWAAVIRLLSTVIRVYAYDRSGLGKSQPSKLPPTMSNICVELSQLLFAADIAPPYIIVGHSWGGVLSRNFITEKEKQIAGMVFVEANQEYTLERLDWRPIFNWFVENGINVQKVLGFPERSMLTATEWVQYRADDAKSYASGQAAAEQAQYQNSFPDLAKKQQMHRTPPYLRSTPLAVVTGENVKDLSKLYQAVVEKNGTTEQSLRFRDFLVTFGPKDIQLQSEPLTLSAKTRLVHSPGAGHNVELTNPEVIVDLVKWVAVEYSKDYCGGSSNLDYCLANEK